MEQRQISKDAEEPASFKIVPLTPAANVDLSNKDGCFQSLGMF